jgi:hypothetical protein
VIFQLGGIASEQFNPVWQHHFKINDLAVIFQKYRTAVWHLGQHLGQHGPNPRPKASR